jgi:2-pyrone-4,6-dicarboxylate lactonase
MSVQAPAGAWDCHTHVFGPPERFPARIESIYGLPEAPAATHRETLAAVGIERAVLIQPAPYGQDASAMIDALRASGGRLRGVASARADIGDAALAEMNDAGVRGLRFLEARTPAGERYAGSVDIGELTALAPTMRANRWHAEVWASLDDLLGFWPTLEKAGLPIVLDHMGGFDPNRGVDAPAFQRLLAMVRDGAVWVKLTLCRRAPFGSDYSELRPFHDALIEANPRRLLWGSDWPFVRMGEHTPRLSDILSLFLNWVDDEALRKTILVDNPVARYGA